MKYFSMPLSGNDPRTSHRSGLMGSVNAYAEEVIFDVMSDNADEA